MIGGNGDEAVVAKSAASAESGMAAAKASSGVA